MKGYNNIIQIFYISMIWPIHTKKKNKWDDYGYFYHVNWMIFFFIHLVVNITSTNWLTFSYPHPNINNIQYREYSFGFYGKPLIGLSIPSGVQWNTAIRFRCLTSIFLWTLWTWVMWSCFFFMNHTNTRDDYSSVNYHWFTKSWINSLQY